MLRQLPRRSCLAPSVQSPSLNLGFDEARGEVVFPAMMCAVDTIPSTDDAGAWLLGLIFGTPSLVVTTFLVATSLWSWWSLGRSAVSTSMLLATRSRDTAIGRSFKTGATLRAAVAWVIFYGAASFVTQLWAGSTYSPGQGGGLGELLRWSAVFGGIAVLGCLIIAPSRAPKHGDGGWLPRGLFIGYALGLMWALVAFTMNGGPTPGDWWVCPALSCIGVLGSAFQVRLKSVRSWASAS